MTIDDALYTYLSTYAGLKAIVGFRIYPMSLPDKVQLPAVVFSKTGEETVHAFGNDPGLKNLTYEVISMASTYYDAVDLSAQVLLALKDYTGTMGGSGGVVVQRVFFEGEEPNYAAENDIHYVTQNFIIWHQ